MEDILRKRLMVRWVKDKNLHKCALTRLQLNSSSPSLLNSGILKLLVLNGNGLEKKVNTSYSDGKLWHSTVSNATIFNIYRNFSVECLSPLLSFLLAQIYDFFDKRPPWLDLLTENIIGDPWSNKWLSSAQSNENIKRYPDLLFTNQARSHRPLLPLPAERDWDREERALGTTFLTNRVSLYK